jgi:hypothetical protein
LPEGNFVESTTELETLRIHNMGEVVARTAVFKYRPLNFGVEVTFDKAAVGLAEWAANRRNVLAAANRRRLKYGFKQDGERVGCYAELAVVALTGLPWVAVLDKLNTRGRKDADVGETLQVRGTENAPAWIKFYPDDPDDAPFIAVTARPPSPVVTIYGWMYGHEVRAAGQFVNLNQGCDSFYKGLPEQQHDLCLLPEDCLAWSRCYQRGYVAEIEQLEQARTSGFIF